MKKIINLSTLFLLISFVVNAQVGINESSPSQKLDVNGKIEISNDNDPATEGAIRYDNSTKDFEGYNGSSWNSFTMSQGILPAGAEAYVGRVTINTDGTWSDFTMRKMSTNSNTFVTVPTDKYFIVTSASFTGPLSGASQNKNYSIRVAGSFDSNIEVIQIRGRTVDGLQSAFTNGFAPLIILEQGEKVRAQHPNFVDDESSVNVYVRGWLVDDVDF